MDNYNAVPQGKDPGLWKIAKKRAGFKSHLISYIVVNLFLWVLWYLTQQGNDGFDGDIPWPVWSCLGWGIGLVSHFFSAYVYPQADAAEREYERLKSKQR